ncbi:hypothetical protein DAMA08_039790 [Martiniozyma asiatica (nom. inval.)]|nr:hypothetical protein DAMA08_039790 [Martiniozyma asiatica]
MTSDIIDKDSLLGSINVNSKSVLESIKSFPRKHLGCYLYNPQTMIPIWTANHPNCTIDIYIPQIYLQDINLNDRKLWGTDIYTDDSDIVSILVHLGVIRLIESNNGKEPYPDVKPVGMLPQIEPLDSDNLMDLLIVRVVITPGLKLWKGCDRFGLVSRTWGLHDGAGIMVDKIWWFREGLRDWKINGNWRDNGIVEK